MTQTAIEVPDQPVDRGPCAWCGGVATHDLEVHPASYTTTAHGVRVVKKRATVVPVCTHHFNSLKRKDDA